MGRCPPLAGYGVFDGEYSLVISKKACLWFVAEIARVGCEENQGVLHGRKRLG